MSESKQKTEQTFAQRKAEYERLKEKFPNRIPVIATVSDGSDLPPLDKNKFLVPSDLTMGQFTYVIRRRIELAPEKAMFLFVNNAVMSSAQLMSQVYEQHKGNDGFLYVSVSSENTFGNF